jgi:hypothetical protein
MTAPTSTINSETFIASGSRIISPGNPELPWMAFIYVLQSTLGLPAQDWTTLNPAYSGTGGNGLKTYGTTTFFTVMDGTTYFGEWLQLQVGTSRTLGKHSFQAAVYNSARAPYEYFVAGSNNGINWGIIDSQISLTAWTVNSIQNCQCVFTGHTFTYFRLIVLATGATGDGCIHRGVVSVFKYCISVLSCHLLGLYNSLRHMCASSTCVSCQAGTYSRLQRHQHYQQRLLCCLACAAGTYQTGTGITTSASCLACAAGTYGPGVCITTSASCLGCAAGTYQTGVGITTSARCLACGAGTYWTGTGAAGSASCLACVTGTFSNGA